MRQDLDAEVKLLPSGGGVFEVVVDGTLTYSKKATGEFPDDDVLLRDLKN